MLIIATCMTVFVHSFIPIGPPNTYAYIHYNDHSRKVSACRVFCADAPLQQPQIIILMQGLSMCVCVCVCLVPSTKALMMTPDIVVPTTKRRIT